MIPLPPTFVPDARTFNPYFAGFHGKNELDASTLENRIDALSESVRNFLFDSELPEKLSTATAGARLPAKYFVAFTKIVFLVILGDVAVTAPEQLLLKLGVEAPTASQLAQSLNEIFKPLLSARAENTIRDGMRPLEPLTQHLGVPAPLPPSSNQAPARNTIDLRTTKPTV